MTDRRLQVFHCVARHLSITTAAKLFCLTPQAVTVQIRQLEEHLNTRLFRRVRGAIVLTPAGEMVQDYAAKILALEEEMTARVSGLTGELSGPLLVGASHTVAEFYLPQILGEFKLLFPGVQVELSVDNSRTIAALVADRAIDLGILSLCGAQPAPTDITEESICEDELRLICTPRHPIAALGRVAAADLAAEPMVIREPGSGTRQAIDRYLANHGVAPDGLNVVMELASPETLKGVVESGLGVSILSRVALAKELKLGSLRALPLDPPLVRRLSVATPAGTSRSRLLSTFIDFAVTRMRAMAAAR